MNYYIRYIDLPCSVKGFTVKDEFNFYNIYTNARLSAKEQNEAINHELRHIKNNDFERENEVIINIKNNIIKSFV